MNPSRALRGLILLLTPLAAFAAPKLTEFLPARSYAVMQMDNSAHYRELWKRSPWARTLEDEQVARFFAPLRESSQFQKFQDQLKAETGRTFEELLSLFNAQMAAAITDFSIPENEGAEPTVGALFILELGGKRDVMEDLLKPKPGKPEDKTWDFRGVTVHEHPGDKPAKDAPDSKKGTPDMFWALVDDYWVVATPRASMEEAIATIQQGGTTESLARVDGFRQLQQRTGEQPVVMYLNCDRLVTEFGRFANRAMEESLKKNPQGNPLGLTVAGVLHASGLDTLESIYCTASVGEDSTDVNWFVTYREERGLTKVFAASNGAINLPEWVRADWSSAAVLNLSLSHVYSVIEEVIQGLNPGLLTMMQGQIQMSEQRMGFNLKRDLLETLGDVMVVGDIPGPDKVAGTAAALEKGQDLIAISTNNPNRLRTSLEALGNMGGQRPQSMFETRDYLGTTIYSLRRPPNAPPSAKGFAFAIEGGFLVFCVGESARPLESVLQSMKGSARGSLWDKPEVRQVISQMPPRAIGYSYQDMAALVAAVFDVMAVTQNHPPAPKAKPETADDGTEKPDDAEPAGEAAKFVDESQKPSVDLLRRYWSTSIAGTWRDGHVLHTLTKISHKPAKP